MAKKNNATEKDFLNNANATPSASNVKPAPAKAEKRAKKANKKPGFFKRLGAKIKDIFSELKKVSWPSFAKVVKKTGVVLVVVLLFLVVITAFDAGLAALLKLI